MMFPKKFLLPFSKEVSKVMRLYIIFVRNILSTFGGNLLSKQIEKELVLKNKDLFDMFDMFYQVVSQLYTHTA